MINAIVNLNIRCTIMNSKDSFWYPLTKKKMVWNLATNEFLDGKYFERTKD